MKQSIFVLHDQFGDWKPISARAKGLFVHHLPLTAAAEHKYGSRMIKEGHNYINFVEMGCSVAVQFKRVAPDLYHIIATQAHIREPQQLPAQCWLHHKLTLNIEREPSQQTRTRDHIIEYNTTQDESLL